MTKNEQRFALRMMKQRLIDADALEKRFEEQCAGNCDVCIYQAIDGSHCGLIRTAPTVDITEEQAIDKLHETGWMQKHDKEMTARPTGEWYYSCQNGWHCSICQQIVKDMPTVMGKANFHYCPNCGVKMEV